MYQLFIVLFLWLQISSWNISHECESCVLTAFVPQSLQCVHNSSQHPHLDFVCDQEDSGLQNRHQYLWREKEGTQDEVVHLNMHVGFYKILYVGIYLPWRHNSVAENMRTERMLCLGCVLLCSEFKIKENASILPLLPVWGIAVLCFLTQSFIMKWLPLADYRKTFGKILLCYENS